LSEKIVGRGHVGITPARRALGGEPVARHSRRVAVDGPSPEMSTKMPTRDAEDVLSDRTGLDTKSLPPNGG
jgi:hypothetical protein